MADHDPTDHVTEHPGPATVPVARGAGGTTVPLLTPEPVTRRSTPLRGPLEQRPLLPRLRGQARSGLTRVRDAVHGAAAASGRWAVRRRQLVSGALASLHHGLRRLGATLLHGPLRHEQQRWVVVAAIWLLLLAVLLPATISSLRGVMTI